MTRKNQKEGQAWKHIHPHKTDSASAGETDVPIKIF